MQKLEIKSDEMSELEQRLRKAATDVEAKRQVLAAATELRDDLVVKAYDSLSSLSRVAKVALVSQQRILQIVARRG